MNQGNVSSLGRSYEPKQKKQTNSRSNTIEHNPISQFEKDSKKNIKRGKDRLNFLENDTGDAGANQMNMSVSGH